VVPAPLPQPRVAASASSHAANPANVRAPRSAEPTPRVVVAPPPTRPLRIVDDAPRAKKPDHVLVEAAPGVAAAPARMSFQSLPPQSPAAPRHVVAPPPFEPSNILDPPVRAETPFRLKASDPMDTPRPTQAPPSREARSSALPPDSAVVLPTTKSQIRREPSQPGAEHGISGLRRLLRLAIARGASTVYVSSNERASVRVDGDVQMLDDVPILSRDDVESLMLSVMPTGQADALRTGMATEWICELPDLGRVRCMNFRDHRGPGGVFRMVPAGAMTLEQLGLSLEIQSLAGEREGLVLIAGPRSSGKQAVIGGLVDLISRTRRGKMIMVEREVNVVQERQGALFISQREARGLDDTLAVARGALLEDPDILVLHEARSAPLMTLALEAAAAGRLVIAGFTAHSATGAIERIVDLYPPGSGGQVQLSLAQHLRGVVGQVLLPKVGGGRIAAREVLLNTPAMASVLAQGKIWQLPVAFEAGRQHGMMSLNEALVELVQSGAVAPDEAYRRAPDPSGFLEGLNRQGLDTSFTQRLAEAERGAGPPDEQ
jgi:twitching motility protein PilT